MWWVFPFGWLLFLVFVFFALRFWGCGWAWRRRERGRDISPDDILKSRLARGEIDEAEYRRLREILAH
jgi:uncharacterized membrane protein